MKHLGHQHLKPNQQLPEYFSTPNRLAVDIQKLATKDTAKYLYNLPIQPEIIPARDDSMEAFNEAKALLRQEAWKRANVNGFVAEYGVHQGESLVQLCELNKDNETFGFDSFEGLPGGTWSGNMIHQGAFDHGGKITFDPPSNSTIVIGWYKETCPIHDYKKPVAKFLHIDCDVYSSTVDIFNTLQGKIVPGTIIVFDEYFDHGNWRQGEYKAWQEFVTNNNIQYKYLYVAGMAVALIVI